MRKITNKLKHFTTFFLLLLFTIMKSPGPVKAAAAQQINFDQNYTVKLKNGLDSLLYEFTAAEAGNIHIRLKNTNPVGNQQISAQLFDANNQAVTDKCHGSNVEMPVYSTKGNRTFYLKLESFLGAAETSYELTVNFEPTVEWEMEDNDTAATAAEISAGRPVYGAIQGINEDCDYFKFSLDGNRKVTLTFGPKEVSGESHSWTVSLLDSGNHSVYMFRDSAVKGTYTCYLKKGTYYIKVENFLGAKNIAYSLLYEESVLKLELPVITSIKADGHNGLLRKYVELSNIKIKNPGDATGYTVKAAKKKTMKGNLATENIDFDKNNSKKNVSLSTKLEVRKNYYVQARSYVSTPFNEKICGKYGAVKCKTLKDSLYKQLSKK